MAHKNDYSLIVFFPDKTVKKWSYVHDLKGFVSFLDKTYPNWEYVNVYERRTTSYLKRFYKGNLIPHFLSIFFLTFNLWLKFSNLLPNGITKTVLTFSILLSFCTFIGFNNPATISNLC